jgi:hypothetical protein
MLIRPAIDDTEPIRYRRPNPDGQFSGNILDEAMRATSGHASNDKRGADISPLDNLRIKSLRPSIIRWRMNDTQVRS